LRFVGQDDEALFHEGKRQLIEEDNAMKIDLLTKIVLGVIAVVLALNFSHRLFIARPALAINDDVGKGRYQISAWAAQSQGNVYHSGYYVLDTLTGKVVDKAADEHVQEAGE
jgi:hypothetical protein